MIKTIQSHLDARVWQLFSLLHPFPAVDGPRMPEPIMITIVVIKILIVIIKIIIVIINIIIDAIFTSLITNLRFPIGGCANGTPYQADTVLGEDAAVHHHGTVPVVLVLSDLLALLPSF